MPDTQTFDKTNSLLVQQDDTGLTLTVQTPPRTPDAFAMLFFCVGVGTALMGGYVIVAHSNWAGLLLLCIGLALAVMMYVLRTRRMRGTVDRYHVAVAGDDVLFSHNESPPQLFSHSKIGRIWITHHTTNGVTTGHDLTLYYDGIERYLCSISNVVETLGSGDELLDRIVDYLNESGKERLLDTDAVADAGPILAGYRSDYACGTPQAAQDQRVLRPAGVRLRYSFGLALLLLLLCFLPLRPYFALIAPSYAGSIWMFLVIAAVLWYIGPLAYTISLSFCGACICRMRGDGWMGMPLAAVLSAWLLQSAVNYAGRQFGLPIPDIVIVSAMTALMTWIFFRAISGCSCGSHPER
ncbi:hypothetical protein [Trichlorobacter lovleyi]|jgi:hypothetical protein|uniref:Uncharacterized protein n=1 Tax=Trichlorobacter lovleyi (strain ATCC BAA-1151 / DSM 17278 / SZ) TaxID=398767 RepID=B3E562_TRIL1|nr:hypothetical protein [Trichlorobacter lovleyi]ACD96049.1 hypothetical protein Glov_2333 [Trichlorobacter lovleyi SZ]